MIPPAAPTLDLQRALWLEAIRVPSAWARLSEQCIENFYTALIREGDQALDLGANAGRHTLPMARAVGDSGLVIAVEPIPHMAAGLRQSLEKAGLASRVRIVEAAVAEQAGTAVFHVATGQEALSSLSLELVEGRQARQIQPVQVRVIRVDEAFAEVPLRFIKLDIEGAEFMALKGAEGVLRGVRPVLEFEDGRGGSARSFGYEMRDFYGYFESVDYVVLDLFGMPAGMANIAMQGPWNFYAVPRERLEEISHFVRYALDMTLLRLIKE